MKRTIAILITVLIFALAVIPASASTAEEMLRGDANLDGYVSITDATCVQRHLAELETLSESGITAADTDKDGNITIADATEIQRYLAEFENIYEIGEPITDTDENTNRITLTVNNKVLTATLADNSSADALMELLKKGPLTISMQDYSNMEKVGDIGTSLPTNNEQITTESGDLILYMGRMLVIYYALNSWDFTRLGKINDVSADELKAILGDEGVTVTISI